ncbi:response regulator transcription factor [Myroides sp. WP-1]|uniref:response regulator transcription factor n=1 Tax=Myroides sp. WP-1 TaxID=2759944 RepID=UPI0015F81096|nr:response regulator transcription factor [Myroides sp. WP-1]MBB1138099.1 response regulator transcription factor [Myroides sp. WP-1]
MKHRITLVEDDTLILELIKDFLNASENFEVSYSFVNGTSFYESFSSIIHTTDLIIMDFQLGDTTAEKLLELIQLEQMNIPVLILTAHYNQSLIGYMLKLGVSCYLPKYIKLTEFLIILKEVLLKGHYISSEQFPYLKESVYDSSGDLSVKKYNISKREVDIIYLLAKQCTAKEIGNRLFLAPKTVENYKNTLFTKTGTKSIVGLVLWAINKRIFTLDQFSDL